MPISFEDRMAVVQAFQDAQSTTELNLISGGDLASQQAAIAAAANDFTDQLVVEILNITGDRAAGSIAASTLARTNAAIAAVLELPEIIEAIANGEDVTQQQAQALGALLAKILRCNQCPFSRRRSKP